MICQIHPKLQESLEALRASVKQILLDETAYSEEIIEKNLSTDGRCILWSGLKNNKGYGKCWYPATKKLVLLHRLVWSKYHKVGVVFLDNILHSCDTPNCINPEHLRRGSQSENIQECFDKGRHLIQAGDTHARRKVSSTEVLEMRRLYALGVMQKDLAVRFGLAPNSVSYIITRRNWGHI